MVISNSVEQTKPSPGFIRSEKYPLDVNVKGNDQNDFYLFHMVTGTLSHTMSSVKNCIDKASVK